MSHTKKANYPAKTLKIKKIIKKAKKHDDIIEIVEELVKNYDVRLKHKVKRKRM